MIKLLFKLPRKLTVAFSGGVDSVAAVDFLSKNHDVNCAFFHHGTENSERALSFVQKFCGERKLAYDVGFLTAARPASKSLEEHWRDERYKFLDHFETVVTGHHLNDCVETYLWSTFHGSPKIIPSQRGNVFRPFLLTSKSEFVSWCQRKGVAWCEDLSNDDDRFMRNYVRKHIVPHAYKVNPGLEKVVAKLVRESQKPA